MFSNVNKERKTWKIKTAYYKETEVSALNIWPRGQRRPHYHAAEPGGVTVLLASEMRPSPNFPTFIN